MGTRLKGKVAIVTGGSRGIGEAIALAYVREGAKVVICSRKQDGLDAAKARILEDTAEATVEAWACHTGDAEQIKALVARAADELGTPDVLVNNAATNPHFGPMLQVEDWQWDKTFDVNLKGYFEMTRQVATAAMAAKKSASIINISSMLGTGASPLQGVYGVTKAGVISMTQTLAVELGRRAVRVNAIAPGLIETKFASILINTPDIMETINKRTALGRHGQPHEIAGAAVFLASDESTFITGQTLHIDGGYRIA